MLDLPYGFVCKNLSSNGYVLFHHRNKVGQHLFAVKGACKVVTLEAFEDDRYRNLDTIEMYVSVDIDGNGCFRIRRDQERVYQDHSI